MKRAIAIALALLGAAACESEPAGADAGAAIAVGADAASDPHTETSTDAPSPMMMQLAVGTGRVELPPKSTRLGVRRMRVRRVAKGPRVDDPTVAVTSDGRVFVAHVHRQGPKERIVLTRARGPKGPLRDHRTVGEGSRAWHPRLAAGPEGALWLTWCGRRGKVERGDHRREVFLRRLAPAPMKKPLRVAGARASANDRSRRCDPDLFVDEAGNVHVVWEDSQAVAPLVSRVAYRRVHPDGSFSGPPEIVSPGPFARRPTVVADAGRVHVAWDELVTDGPAAAMDPDYDVFVRTRHARGWGDVTTVEDADGIQAAPSLTKDGEGLVVAYHTSLPHGLVKRFTLRRITAGGEVQSLAKPPLIQALMPTGQNQGSEVPSVTRLSDGRLLVASRASHGAFVHVVSVEGVTPALDLTRRGWGARGLRLDTALARDGSVLVARRARHGVVLERFDVEADAQAGPPEFRPSGRRPKADLPVPDAAPKRPSAKHPALANAKILYGDVHMHSGFSDGTGPPDEIYARCLARGMHFCALTDHDYVVGAQMMLSEHDEIRWLTDVFDARPDFTALHAYEWTTKPVPRGYGHRNVYFRADAPSPLFGSRNGYGDTKRLHRALRSERAFTAPHHTGWTGTDWQNADPRVQRHLEIVSVHGAFEDPRGQPIPTRGVRRGMFAVDGLKRGLEFGFLGGSDGHGILWHHGVGRRMDPWNHGLTGVLAVRNDREALWDALYARRTFATSGARISVLTSIDRAVQGDRVTLSGPPTLKWRAEGTEPLREVMVVRDGEPIYREAPGRRVVKGRFVDEDVEPGPHSYYVRVTQGQGIEGTDAGWSSPIFVRLKDAR